MKPSGKPHSAIYSTSQHTDMCKNKCTVEWILSFFKKDIYIK